jgi:transposase
MENLTMKKTRRSFSSSEKAAIVKRHLVEGVPVSDLCDEYRLQPTQIDSWQKQLFDNAAVAFERPGRRSKQQDAQQRKIAALEAKMAIKNEVVAELLEEHVQLKKELGDL